MLTLGPHMAAQLAGDLMQRQVETRDVVISDLLSPQATSTPDPGASGPLPAIAHDQSTIGHFSQSVQQLSSSMGRSLAVAGNGLPGNLKEVPGDHETKADEASKARAKVFHEEAARLKKELPPAALDFFALIGDKEKADKEKEKET